MKLGTSFFFYVAIFNLLQLADDAKMGLCEKDHILIKSLHEFKGYGAKRLMKEFPTK